MATIEWDDRELQAGLDRYAKAVLRALKSVAQFYEEKLTTYAKNNRPWNDQTGHAKGGLYAFTEELANDTVTLYLVHGIGYGRHLELSMGGKYAIIMPTIQAHSDEINTMLQEIFR